MALLLNEHSEKSEIFYANYLKCFLLVRKRMSFSAFPNKIQTIKCPENPLIFRSFKWWSTCTKVFMLQSLSENSQRIMFHRVDYWLQFGIEKIIFRPLVFRISLIFHEHSILVQAKVN